MATRSRIVGMFAVGLLAVVHSTVQAQGPISSSTGDEAGQATQSDQESDQESAKDTPAEEARKKCEALKKNIANAHKPLYFDNDFSYLTDPNYCGFLIGDNLKRRCFAGRIRYDLGGEYRIRFHDERNMRGLGLTGVDDTFLLHRTRLYGNFEFSPNLRAYAEMIDAESNFENVGPRPIEVNRADLLNLFVDAQLMARGDDTFAVRVGRQELLLGDQRFISPLDWANTRRTFEGVRLTRKSKNFTWDGFWVNPMRVDPNSFDNADSQQEFMGFYASQSCQEGRHTDFYLLRYINDRAANDFEVNTVGLRDRGSEGNALWDFEAAYQFGKNTDGSTRAAGMATVGLGRKFPCRLWEPVLWLYYDWASGDNSTGAGNGFDHLFPLAHKYNGFMDLFGRRNLQDVNLQLAMSPRSNLKLLVWYHYFALQNRRDTPYSVVMTPFNPGNLPGSSDLGHEIDLLATYQVSPRQQWLMGYSRFFSGKYYRTTTGVPFSNDADFFYTQWAFQF